MKNFKVISNYASALLKLANTEQTEDKMLNALETFYNIIAQDIKIYDTLTSPVISKDFKIKIIKSIIKNYELTETVNKFLISLIKNSRIDCIPDIINHYSKILADKRGIKIVDIVSAKELNKIDKINIHKFLSTEFEKLKINYARDASIIGGFIVKYDNNLIDYSIKGALNQLLS